MHTQKDNVIHLFGKPKLSDMQKQDYANALDATIHALNHAQSWLSMPMLPEARGKYHDVIRHMRADVTTYQSILDDLEKEGF